MTESYLTTAEVAEILKLHPQAIRNWILRGDLPALRLGRSHRIARSDFERFIDASYRVPSGTPDTQRSSRHGPELSQAPAGQHTDR
jgi:excisionase family DNA binding protein